MGLGKEVHSILEDWATSGQIVAPRPGPAFDIAASARPHLPVRGEGVGLYAELNIASPPTTAPFRPGLPMQRIGASRVPFVGFVYLLHLPPNGVPEVIDYKTTSGLQWALTEEQLRADPQAIGYARFAHLTLGAPEVDIKFIYLLTRGGRGSATTRVRLDYRYISDMWESMGERVDSMVALAREAPTYADIGKVPYDTEGCDMYRGCPHRARCYGSSAPPHGLPRPQIHPFFQSLIPTSELKRKANAMSTNKSKLASVPAAPAPSGTARPPEAPPAPTGEAPPATVLVNAVYSKGPQSTPLEAWLDPIVKGLEELHGVPYLLALKFNEWRAPLVAALRDAPLPRGLVLTARGGSPIVEQALEVLRARPDCWVVEGVR